MKRYLVTLCLMALSVLAAHAQTGSWSGSLDVNGAKLLLVFNIDGENTTLDVPDQSAKGIPATVDFSPEGKLMINVPSIGARYEGFMLGKMIAGTFRQSGIELPLTLKPGVPELKRPQTPVGPFPYSSEEVSFTNGDAVLRGTLTLPDGWTATTPVVIMVTGSGLQDRDEGLYEHKPFAVIADALARGGIASLRYDDRGCGASTGSNYTATILDYMADAEAGLALLRERFDSVGVIGHSEGGSIALMLADEGKVDFAISLAGMVISGAETLLDQNRYSLSRAGLPAEDSEKYYNALVAAFDAIRSGEPLPSPAAAPEILRENYKLVLAQIQTVYMRQFIKLDLSSSIKSISCPVLALNGTKDIQVNSSKNLEALRPLLRSPLSVISEQPGLNHLFQHCQTGDTTEYKTIEETFSPDVLTLMLDWVRSL